MDQTEEDYCYFCSETTDHGGNTCPNRCFNYDRDDNSKKISNSSIFSNLNANENKSYQSKHWSRGKGNFKGKVIKSRTKMLTP